MGTELPQKAQRSSSHLEFSQTHTHVQPYNTYNTHFLHPELYLEYDGTQGFTLQPKLLHMVGFGRCKRFSNWFDIEP